MSIGVSVRTTKGTTINTCIGAIGMQHNPKQHTVPNVMLHSKRLGAAYK
jgi:hypothetical protein